MLKMSTFCIIPSTCLQLSGSVTSLKWDKNEPHYKFKGWLWIDVAPMWICCLWFDFGMGETTKGHHLKNAIRLDVQVWAESPQTKKSCLMTVSWLELLTWTLASHFLPSQESVWHFSMQYTIQNMIIYPHIPTLG